MEQLFEYMSHNIPFPFVVVGFLIMFGIVCTLIYECYKARLSHDLKKSMLERGMSAQEIELVIKAEKDSTKTDTQATE